MTSFDLSILAEPNYVPFGIGVGIELKCYFLLKSPFILANAVEAALCNKMKLTKFYLHDTT